ncbi:MAG: hypothetical protein M5R41_10370 [Bacteroidia bacterium]|nr:hypothetical protein [Bacteroidia bacterium]
MEYAILAISLLASALSGVAVWLLKDLKRSSDELHGRVTSLEVLVARDYVRTDQLTIIIRAIMQGMQCKA